MNARERYEQGFWFKVQAANFGHREDPIWTINVDGADDPEWAAWTVLISGMIRGVDEDRIPEGSSIYIEGAIT